MKIKMKNKINYIMIFFFFIVTVYSGAVGISTTSLPYGTELMPYSHQLQSTNGTAPYEWSIMPKIVAWGRNNNGQCDVPSNLVDVIQISAGISHVMALQSNGLVVAWGRNNEGQCDVPIDMTNAVDIVTYMYTSYALRDDGIVVAWGANDKGQRDVPTGLSNVTSIASGFKHGMALKSDGTVVAWGDNSQGQCDVPGGLSNVVGIAAGGWHSVALKSDGTVVAWGWNYYNQCDVPAGLSNVVKISAVFHQAMALKLDGTVVAWGENSKGQCDVPVGLNNVVGMGMGRYHTAAVKSDGSLVMWGSATPATVLDGVVNVKSVSLSLDYTITSRNNNSQLPAGMSLSSSGVLSGTAANTSSSLITFIVEDAVTNSDAKAMQFIIDENSNMRPIISSISPTNENVSITEGGATTTFSVVASDPEGSNVTYQWEWDGAVVGSNSASYLYDTSWNDEGAHQLRCYVSDGYWDHNVYQQWNISVIDVPTDITTASLPNGTNSVSYSYQLSAINGEQPYRWYIDSQVKVLGKGSSSDSPALLAVGRVLAVAAGHDHSILLGADNTVVAWGNNSKGQCDVPGGLSGVTAIASGGKHNLALKSDGTVVAWGENDKGQCDVPGGLSGVTAIVCGYKHSMALKLDKTVVAWGAGLVPGTYEWPDYGQSVVPASLSNVEKITAGYYHSMALKSDGTVVAWGINNHRQCVVPVGINNVQQITAGYYHSMALKNDGKVVVWGNRKYGQYDVPGGLSGVTAIAAGTHHNLALKSDGTVVVWDVDWYGLNDDLGVGNIQKITSGSFHSLALLPITTQLPAGLTITTGGLISGTPIESGTFNINIKVYDTFGYVVIKQFTLVVE